MQRWELLVLGAILLIFLGVAIYVIAVGPPLIYDEAVYTLPCPRFRPRGSPQRVLDGGGPSAEAHHCCFTPLSAVGGSDVLLRSGALLVTAAAERLPGGKDDSCSDAAPPWWLLAWLRFRRVGI